MFLILLFILGLIVGSFLNCVIYRLEKDQSFISGRSFCPHCNHVLNWQDLVPVLSFIFLKRKCRYCYKLISWQYPLVELSTAILFLFIGFNFSDPISLIYYLVIVSLLLIVFVFDLKHHLIPDRVVYLAIGATAFWHLFSKAQILNFILAAIGVGLFFLAIYFLTHKKGLGLGDVEIAFFMGLFLGFPMILLAVFLAFSSGALIGIILIFLSKKTLKSELAFGPFLVVATLFSAFFGQPLINLYLGFLGY
ncbi:prepilin peptidase [Candidatus Parcubacteria bacterium]|nr:prepilin peptidase [Candidatus Parcubacteria bacterium]